MKPRFITFFVVFGVSVVFFSSPGQAQKLQSIANVTYSTVDPSAYTLKPPSDVHGYDVFSVDGVLFEFTYLDRNLTIHRNGVATQTLPASVHRFLSVDQLFCAKGKYYMLAGGRDTLSIFQLNIESGKLILKTSIPKFYSRHLIGDYFLGCKATDGLHAKQLYGINVDNFRLEKLADISSLIPAENGIGNLDDFGDGQHILMTVGRHAYNTCDYTPSHYVMYNVVTKKVENVARQVAALHVDGDRPAFHDEFSRFLGGARAERGRTPVVVDGNMSIRLDTLIFSYCMDPHGYAQLGWVYENGKITGLFGRNSGEDGAVVRVKIGEFPVVQMNKLAVKMFLDKPFTRNELSGLSPYALAWLENGLYARYGLPIKDPYWKSFFADQYRKPEKLSENARRSIAIVDQRLQEK